MNKKSNDFEHSYLNCFLQARPSHHQSNFGRAAALIGGANICRRIGPQI